MWFIRPCFVPFVLSFCISFFRCLLRSFFPYVNSLFRAFALSLFLLLCMSFVRFLIICSEFLSLCRYVCRSLFRSFVRYLCMSFFLSPCLY